jgi:hypothetical protein
MKSVKNNAAVEREEDGWIERRQTHGENEESCEIETPVEHEGILCE